MDNLTASVEGKERPPKVGDLMIGWMQVDGHSWAYWAVTSVTPILTKGDASGRVVEVKVEGYCLGLKRSYPPI